MGTVTSTQTWLTWHRWAVLWQLWAQLPVFFLILRAGVDRVQCHKALKWSSVAPAASQPVSQVNAHLHGLYFFMSRLELAPETWEFTPRLRDNLRLCFCQQKWADYSLAPETCTSTTRMTQTWLVGLLFSSLGHLVVPLFQSGSEHSCMKKKWRLEETGAPFGLIQRTPTSREGVYIEEQATKTVGPGLCSCLLWPCL